MIINAIFVKSTKEILFSRSQHDMRSSEDNKNAIDGGFDYIRVIDNFNNTIPLKLDGDFLLKSILSYDYLEENTNAHLYPNGYHGRWKITEKSSIKYFNQLVINFEDVLEYFNQK